MTGKYVTIGLLVLVVVLLVVACASPTIDTFVTNTNFNNGAFTPNSNVSTRSVTPMASTTLPATHTQTQPTPTASPTAVPTAPPATPIGAKLISS